MEHTGTTARDVVNPAELIAALGITDDMAVDVPPEWVSQALTVEQRALFSRLVLHTAGQGLGTIDTMAMVLFKLALQPGLPPQAGGFLVFSAAELYAGFVMQKQRQGLACLDLASTLGLINSTEFGIAEAAAAPENEDQDAGVPHGVGA